MCSNSLLSNANFDCTVDVIADPQITRWCGGRGHALIFSKSESISTLHSMCVCVRRLRAGKHVCPRGSRQSQSVKRDDSAKGRKQLAICACPKLTVSRSCSWRPSVHAKCAHQPPPSPTLPLVFHHSCAAAAAATARHARSQRESVCEIRREKEREREFRESAAQCGHF